MRHSMQTDFFGASTQVLTVAALTRAIRDTLETKFGAVWVQGEISNYKQHPSGHQYFTLKDSRAQIACVIFRNAPLSLRQPLADGAQVQVYGNVSVFEARGQYQLSVEIVQPRGLGLLQAKFEALKRKLEAEGLFDPARKKLLPKFPKRIGIVTSPSGAAELIVPAAAELDRRVNEFAVCLQRCWRNFIVREQTRLRMFSERTVARELLRRIQEGKQKLDWRRENLQRNAVGFLGNSRGRLAENAAALRRHDPSREIILRWSRFAELARRLITCPPQLANTMRKRFERTEKILAVLGPDATLRRGYSMTTDVNGDLVRSVTQVKPGDKIRTRLADGAFESDVIGKDS